MSEGNFSEQPQQKQSETPERAEFELDNKDTSDANAIADDWDQYMAKSESIPEEKPENLSVQKMEGIESELRGNQEADEPVSESKKDFPFKWFKTEKGSILKEEPVSKDAPSTDETPAQNVEMEKTKIAPEEIAAEPIKEEHQAESTPASSEKPVGNKEKKEIGEIAINKEIIIELIDVGRKLARAFRERDEERLNPLIEERDIFPLVASFDNLHMLLRDDKRTVNGEELNHAITRIANTIQNIDNVPRGQNMQSMRDNAESLGKVVFYLEEVGDKAHDFGVFLSRKEENRPEEILQALRRLENIIKDRRDFVARKRNALDQYKK